MFSTSLTPHTTISHVRTARTTCALPPPVLVDPKKAQHMLQALTARLLDQVAQQHARAPVAVRGAAQVPRYSARLAPSPGHLGTRESAVFAQQQGPGRARPQK